MQPPIAVEIKASTSPKLTRGNWNAKRNLAPRATYVVYPGQQRWPMAEDVEALPIHEIASIAESE